MKAPVPASWDGWWQLTASVRWWPHPFLACGLINDHAGSRWCAPSSSTSQPISTTPMYTCPELIISSICSYPERLWALEQVIVEMLTYNSCSLVLFDLFMNCTFSSALPNDDVLSITCILKVILVFSWQVMLLW